MASPELRPISVPLNERELFTSPDHSGGLTPEGSLLQRLLLLNHAILTESLSSGIADQYRATISDDAKRLGIAEQDHRELGSQWGAITQEREQRIRQLSPIAFKAVVFEATEASGS